MVISLAPLLSLTDEYKLMTPAPPSTGSRPTPISTPTTPRLPPCPLRSLSSVPSPVVRTSCTPPTSRQRTPTS